MSGGGKIVYLLGRRILETDGGREIFGADFPVVKIAGSLMFGRVRTRNRSNVYTLRNTHETSFPSCVIFWDMRQEKEEKTTTVLFFRGRPRLGRGTNRETEPENARARE
jgi:hypothetical protein